MDEWEDVKGQRPEPKNSFVVHITSSHLVRGERGNIFGDAPALALKEQLPAVKWAMAGWGYATTGHDNGRKKYWLVSEWAAFVAWMKAYDCDKNPPPAEFTFVLDTIRDEKPIDPKRKPRRQLTPYEYQQREAKKHGKPN